MNEETNHAHRARRLIECLQEIEPLELEAVRILWELEQDDYAPATLVEVQPRVDAAMRELDAHRERVKEVRKRCSALQPIPSQSIPPGF